MNEVKPGIKTTEFWLSAVSGLVVAIMALLIGYGVVTNEQADLWTGLILAASPIAIAIIAANYSKSRSETKAAKE
jgi:hypothetical protein